MEIVSSVLLSLWAMNLFVLPRGEGSGQGCKWTVAGGGVIDLSGIGNRNGHPRFPDVSATMDTFLYSYNPCYPFNEGTCVAAAVCQMTASKSDYYQAGDAAGAELTEVQGKPQIHYHATTEIRRDSYVTLICNKNASMPTLKALGDLSYAEYHLELTTVCACPNGCSAGTPEIAVSTGSILCIILLCLMVVYLLVGIAFNRFRLQKTGSELFPNRPFWRALPGTIKEGCQFSVNKIGLGKRTGYNKI